MEANTRNLERIFDLTISYQIPLFQRPYVWTQENNWEPLWEDMQALLDKHLRGSKIHPHFLGAVVLEQIPNPAGSIECRQVIDGQQRFTTLQLFLIAARDNAKLHGIIKYIERFSDLVSNRRSRVDSDDDIYKVWPTNSNRAAFRAVHEAGSLATLDKNLKVRLELSSGTNNVIDAYRYFYVQLSGWMAGKLDDSDETEAVKGKTIDDRLETLWQIAKGFLQVVVIDLDKDDETQIIFETLNARGEVLLPADLIKNFLFRQAAASGASGDEVQNLYDSHWQDFETRFWREEVKQGRLKRPRIDIYINYYLTLMTRDEVKSSHLFNVFKAFAQGIEPVEDGQIAVPTTPSEHIKQLAHYAKVFKTFADPGEHKRLGTFLRRLDAVDTTTVYPFLLYACAELLPDHKEELDDILVLIESFLVRRMICGLTPKNYNRYFVDLIRSVERSGSVSIVAVKDHMQKGIGDSTKFPSDQEVEFAIKEMPLYGRMSQPKVRSILEALDEKAYTTKTEPLPLPPNLTIEHVMPQKWEAHWHLPNEIASDPIAKQKATEIRQRIVHTLGNLTLITPFLNPALSNLGWTEKKPELMNHSMINLTKYFREKDVNTWDEDAIERRSDYLLISIKEIWPSLC